MAAIAQPSSQAPDRTTDDKPVELELGKEQEKQRTISPDTAQGATTIGHTTDLTIQPVSVSSSTDRTVYSPNIYAPQAQGYYYRGYENGAGEWDEYRPYLNAEGLELGSPGVYNENPSLVFHSGYGYNPQMPYGPYSPVTTPMPSVGGADSQLYSPQQFSYSGPPYYQQLGPPNMPYISSPTPVSQPELTNLLPVDQQGDNMLFGPRPGYPGVGSFGRGSYPPSPGPIGFHDLQPGFDGLRSSGGIWSDWSKSSERPRSSTPFSPAVSPQPIGPVGSFGQNVGMGSQHQRSLYGFGSGSNSYNRGYLPGGFSQGSNASYSGLGDSHSWASHESTKRRMRGSISLCSCNGTIDILNEQNRGPRASKPKAQTIPDENNKLIGPIPKAHDESYNRLDFLTEYGEAKFFIIKSYSEDNVHKSIKYGVWASTPNGNRKLDAAYREAKEQRDRCPIFLLFSVNASAQFCGVAEMIGAVDFDKSVDYWQQDKWSGQFPVNWHIIKDVPNSQFRHIVLENNDNKPVTNSRDTQEVKLDQGIEMLSIFKTYETDMSILDDFEFYEDRQKAMQERKARQQSSLLSVGAINETDHRNTVSIPSTFIKQMSKSFAQVVRLDETSKETERSSSTNNNIKLEETVPSSQTS